MEYIAIYNHAVKQVYKNIPSKFHIKHILICHDIIETLTKILLHKMLNCPVHYIHYLQYTVQSLEKFQEFSCD